jgi:hypothetical protein
MDEEDDLDNVFSKEEQEEVDALSVADRIGIDVAILAVAHQQWRKVGLIVSKLQSGFSPELQIRVPIGFLVQRVAALVQSGQLESQGDLRRMGASEVRLPRHRPPREYS